jgi:hypothetical protein
MFFSGLRTKNNDYLRGALQMATKIGHDYNRDPYPWDGAETLSRSAAWTCCEMNLPATYITCPICGKEREMKADKEQGE